MNPSDSERSVACFGITRLAVNRATGYVQLKNTGVVGDSDITATARRPSV